jgi:hypothetical protein
MTIHHTTDLHIHHDQPIEAKVREFSGTPVISIRELGGASDIVTIYLHDPSHEQTQRVSDVFSFIAGWLAGFADEQRAEEGVSLSA